MSALSRILFLSALLFAPLQIFADAEACARGPESQWATVAASSHASGKPIMVLFSSDECGYCNRLKDEFIRPSLADGTLTRQVVIREFNIDAIERVEDFDGLPVRSRSFVSRYRIFATPTVIILDADGNPIGRPLVGYDNPLDYQRRLQRAIEEAQRLLVAEG